MTTNRLAAPAASTKRSAQEWCDLGNRKLLGLEPCIKHDIGKPRHDVHWVVRDGHPVIEWRL
jgi:hypothetical protein